MLAYSFHKKLSDEEQWRNDSSLWMIMGSSSKGLYYLCFIWSPTQDFIFQRNLCHYFSPLLAKHSNSTDTRGIASWGRIQKDTYEHFFEFVTGKRQEERGSQGSLLRTSTLALDQALIDNVTSYCCLKPSAHTVARKNSALGLASLAGPYIRTGGKDAEEMAE